NPIWKTSYRLVLDKPEAAKDGAGQKQARAEKPYLQGWAVVENTTDEDWNGVRMALISGRPISFQMNLYDALFIKRPVVEPELFASLRPPTYSGGLAFSPDGQHLAAGGTVPMKPGRGGDGKGQEKGGWKADAEGDDRALRDSFRGREMNRTYAEGVRKDLDEKLNLGASVASAASASKLGDYFQYAIDHPVTLPRQKSALLPILGKDVQGERLSIYNETTHAKFPLLGLAFTNTTGMHLTQGPLTVYEGGTY